MTSNITYALIGGLMIGLAAAGMLWTNGRIMGVSGIVGGLFQRKSFDLSWKATFLMGMLSGALVIESLGFSIMSLDVHRPIVAVAFGGLLVGFGTTIGNGCTSGHGVCGISRFSVRSIIATLVFMGFGILTVALMKWWGI